MNFLVPSICPFCGCNYFNTDKLCDCLLDKFIISLEEEIKRRNEED